MTSSSASQTSSSATVQAAAWPAGSTLSGSDVTGDSLTLNWSAATGSVTGYVLLQDDASIAALPPAARSHSVTGLTPRTAYTFKVEASDALGNTTTDGPSVTITTDPPPCTGDACPIPDPALIAPQLPLTSPTDFSRSIEFLYTGANPVQRGVAPGTIHPVRASVMRGRVMTPNGDPLEGVLVTIHGHPELGYTRSRDDGYFDMAVNGGGTLVVQFDHPGAPSVQRQTGTPWRDFVPVEDVVITPYDLQVTTVATGAPMLQVAQGTAVTDEDGTRQATLLFPAGVTAQMRLSDGTTLPLASLEVRATEYTVGTMGPAAMPGLLPPTSAYTYAVAFTVDDAVATGAASVEFSQPVTFYLDNYLDIPVGMVVPTGYYDHEKSTWVPADNGQVVELVAINGGVADLDLNGDGAAEAQAALDALGVTQEERQRLAMLYQVGKRLWRVPIAHFSDWDCNYAPPTPPPPIDECGPGAYRLGADKCCPAEWSPTVCCEQYGQTPEQCLAAPPEPEPEDDNGGGGNDNADTNREPDQNTKKCGSIIGCESRSLGEVIPVPGTSFKLHYQSDRVGPPPELKLAVTSAYIPEGLREVQLSISIAGKVFRQSFPPDPGQNYTFIWDGKDVYGRRLQGSQTATIELAFLYDGDYSAALLKPRAFARFPQHPVGVGRSRATNRYALVNIWKERLGKFDMRGLALGGWGLSVNHVYDPEGRVLYRGDGETRRGPATCLGGGDCAVKINSLKGFDDGSQGARPARTGVAVGPDGVYVNEVCATLNGDPVGYQRVRKIDVNGQVTTIAGNGACGDSGDGGPALEAELSTFALALNGSGRLYLLEYSSLRTIDPDGTIRRLAGSGNQCDQDGPYEGDPLGVSFCLGGSESLVIGPDGTVYIPDSGHHRVLALRPDGLMTTVAGGNGESDVVSGRADGADGPAAAAKVTYPMGLGLDANGDLYIAESYFIRKVTRDGTIRTIAGGALPPWENGGINGDGGPATEAFVYPTTLAFDSAGRLYFADVTDFSPVIRRIDRAGVVTAWAAGGETLATTGNVGLRDIELDWVTQMAFDPDGRLYISDWDSAVKVFEGVLPGYSGGGLSMTSGTEGVYFFGLDGRHERTVDALTGATMYAFAYDVSGRLTGITDRNGRVTAIERDAINGNPVAIVAPGGQRTVLATDVDDNLTSVTGPGGGGVQLGYGANGLLTAFTPSVGAAATFTYDAAGKLLDDTGADGSHKTLVRTPTEDGYIITTTTEAGHQTIDEVVVFGTTVERIHSTREGLQTRVTSQENGYEHTEFPDGSLLYSQQKPDPRFGAMSPYTADLSIVTAAGLTRVRNETRDVVLANPADPTSLLQQTSVVTINNRSITSVLDTTTRTQTTTSPEGRLNVTTYDERGDVVNARNGTLASVSTVRDEEGRVATIMSGGGTDVRTITFIRDTAGRMTELVDAELNSQRFTYDAAGHLSTWTRGDNAVVAFTRDGGGRPLTVTPPSRPAHTFTYTPRGAIASYAAPAIGGVQAVTTYAYDPSGALLQVDHADGSETSFIYNSVGTLTGVVDSVGGTVTTTRSPTSGQVTSIAAPSGVGVAFTYDSFLLTSETFSGPVTGTILRGYNDDLNLVSENVAGHSVAFSYDDDNLMTTAGDFTLLRDENGLVSGATLGILSDTYSHTTRGEPAGKTVSDGTSVLYALTATRDAVGRIATETETISGTGRTRTYGYDEVGRVQTVTEGATTTTYTYDLNGNRIAQSDGTSTITATYDARDRVISYGDTTYTFSANGSLATSTRNGETTTYTYDGLGNLRRVVLGDGTDIEYVIDGLNRRIGKRVNGALVQGFLYRGDRVVAELDGAGTPVRRFVYTPLSKTPAYMVAGGVTYRFVTDRTGSPRLIVNAATGAIAQRLDYDAFGATTQTNPGFQPFGFAGGLYDPATGLTRLGLRDYDGRLGRFTARDPIYFEGGSTNLYLYGDGDPVNLIDTSGACPLPVVGVGVVAGAVVGCLGNGAQALLCNRGAGQAALECMKGVLFGGLMGGFGVLVGCLVADALVAMNVSGVIIKLVAGVIGPIATAIGDTIIEEDTLEGGDFARPIVGGLLFGAIAGKVTDIVAGMLEKSRRLLQKMAEDIASGLLEEAMTTGADVAAGECPCDQ